METIKQNISGGIKDILRKFYPFIILAVLSFTIHFAFLNYPSQTVFDEVHFGKFVAAYSTHEYYFDIHPPLGKLLIAGWAKLVNFNPNFDFDHIGESAAPELFSTLRFLPALFGSIFVLLFSYFAYLVSRSKKTALISGFLMLFDNAFLVQSKFIFIDIFLVFFGILTFCFFVLCQKQKSFSAKWFLLLALTGVSFGLTASIKWTGLASLGIIALTLLVKIFSEKTRLWLNPLETNNLDKKINIKNFKEAAVSLSVIAILGFLVYLMPFIIHFNLLYKSGPGDAFMSSRFQSELKYGRENTRNPLNFWEKFIELNTTMYNASAGLTATHPFGSKWYQWPFDNKPIYYWYQGPTSDNGEKIGKIYFLGNPVVWLLASFFLAITMIRIFIKKERQNLKPVHYFLLLAFFANLLPFIFIKRVSFLYHYLPSASLAILLLSLYLRELWPKKKSALIAALAAIVLGFVILTPLSYGWLMSPDLDKFEMGIINFLSQID